MVPGCSGLPFATEDLTIQGTCLSKQRVSHPEQAEDGQMIQAEDGPHVQGVLNLLDNTEEDGGTQLVPGLQGK